MMRGLLALSVLALGTAYASAAQLGIVEFNGKDVVLNDDNTWAYRDVAAASDNAGGCADSADLVVSKTLKVSACVAKSDWDVGAGTGAQEYVYYSKDGSLGFAIVTETAYAPSAGYRDAIIRYAANAGQVQPSDVKVSEEETNTFDGKAWDSMRYDLTVSGSALSFLNYRYSEPSFGSTQFIFWSLPETGAAAKTAAEKVMQTVKVSQ